MFDFFANFPPNFTHWKIKGALRTGTLCPVTQFDLRPFNLDNARHGMPILGHRDQRQGQEMRGKWDGRGEGGVRSAQIGCIMFLPQLGYGRSSADLCTCSTRSVPADLV